MTQRGENTPNSSSRLVHFTPLRYPGGKGKLAPFVKELLKQNDLVDGEYVEPYAGGAGIALELLLQEYVTRVHINDISRPIYAFWRSVLEHTDQLTRKVGSVKLSVHSWDRQKKIFQNPDDHDDLDLGFAMFFLNRTNRSGILNGGIIGGREQTGPWRIDARYNTKELIHRIEAIARLRSRISLTRKDAVVFLSSAVTTLPRKSLIYLDPPYYEKGKALYYDYYTHDDHVKVSRFVTEKITGQEWIVSYDNEPMIRKLYTGWRPLVYGVPYSARTVCDGAEVMFFSENLKKPKPVGAMRQRPKASMSSASKKKTKIATPRGKPRSPSA